MDVKLVHFFVGGFRIILYLFLCFFAFIAPPSGVLDDLQINVGFFVFFILGLAISNYVFAKIKQTRSMIDKYLGADFVSSHGINMMPRQGIKAAAAVFTVLAVKHGDDYVTAMNDPYGSSAAANAAKNSGIDLPPQAIKVILERQSVTQQIVSAAVETAKESFKKSK